MMSYHEIHSVKPYEVAMLEGKNGQILAFSCTLTWYDVTIRKKFKGTWLAQSVEQATLDLSVGSLSPHMGARVYFKNKYFQKRKKI